ncbi:MAG TPA: hypothetical protein PKM41_12505 [Deltaproteobacteria bacterium]|nr:hypothetical protein [Deltaproteobacteria bacterium]HOI08365.1 hypothetical protein [Deltaproteobacteria bacterium]
MSFSRPLCRTEKIYLVFDENCPGFANQFFFEGTGVLDRKRWEKAVEIASAANPGSRLVLKGKWAFSRWVDSGITPRVVEIDASNWDGLGPVGAPALLNESLPPREGPTCEVVLMHGDPLRVMFRTHHAVMDGRGTLHWAEDVFRALRGINPIGSDSRLTELEMARTFQNKGRTPPPPEFIAPTGMPQGSEPGVTWQRMRIPGRYKNLIGQVAVLLAQTAWLHGQGKIRFGIPVDMRSRQPYVRSTGNLTNMIYLEIKPGDSARDISKEVARQLEARMDGMLYWGDRIIPFVPYGILRNTIQNEIRVKRTTGLYRNSGVLSNMGRVPVEQCHGGGFEANYFWGIPPGQELLPIFVGITYGHEDTTLITSIPRVLASNGRFHALMDHIRNGLVPDGQP